MQRLLTQLGNALYASGTPGGTILVNNKVTIIFFNKITLFCRKWIQSDPRRIPRRGERVPFIIANGPPGVPLIRLVRSPHEMLADEGLKINSIYYITKAIIPPLNRCLLLIGADANDW